MAAVLVLQTLALVVAAETASAHNVLVSSDPADGATLDRVPTQVELVFDQPVQKQFGQVSVLSTDGSDWVAAAPSVVDATVTVALRPLEQTGDYVIAYRLVSADGHPVSGELTFTVTADALGLAPTVEPSASEPTTEADDQEVRTSESGTDRDGDNASGPAWALIAPVALLAVLVAAIVGRRLRTGGRGEEDESAEDDQETRRSSGTNVGRR